MWSTPRAVVVPAVLAVVLAACAGGDGAEPVTDDRAGSDVTAGDADADAETDDADGVLAALGVLVPDVEIADAPADPVTAAYRPGEDGESLVVRDVVRTGAEGFAEVRWFDGAVARVDADTSLVVLALDVEAERPTVTTELDVGRVWSRLQTDSVDYEVRTDVGTAAVRGTAFLVTCAATCTFGVAEGVLAVTTALGIELELRPGEQVTVAADGIPGPVAPFDTNDPWVADNLDRDEDVGFAPVDPTPPPDDDRPATATARLDGGYDFRFELTESNRPELVGQQVQRRWTYFPECSTGACGGEWDPGGGGREPFTWTGRSYAAGWASRPAGSCPDGSARYDEQFTLVVTPTTVEQVDGRSVATVIDAVWRSTLTPLQSAIDSGCDPGDGPTSQVLLGTATRS